jgi:phosphate transport system substrate-binding protein
MAKIAYIHIEQTMKTLIKTMGLVAALTLAGPAFAGNITVKGSDTLVILAQKWAEAYMGKHPETKIQVTGGGSGVGLAALINKSTDLANASRKMKPKEIQDFVKAYGKRPTEFKVALDGLSVFVNAENPVQELSLEQLEGIFTGKIKNWKAVGGSDGPITVYSRENSSGTYEFFKDLVLRGNDFAASAQTMPGTAALLQAVGKDKKGIGYGGAAYGAGAKHLKIKKTAEALAIEPTEESVLKGAMGDSDKGYPIWRYLFIYVNPAADKGDIAAYLKWIRSDDGQKIVKDVGYYPLPPNLREK